MSGNQALSLNPTIADIDIGVGASSFLFAIMSIMGASAIGLLILGYTRPTGQRAFHHLAAAICFTASIAYFTMASDLGAAAIQVEFIRGGILGQQFVDAGIAHPTRSVWYARYIDWTITTPLLLLELLLSTGLPLSEIFQTIFLDEVMIITGLIGALVASDYKWGFFTFGCVAAGEMVFYGVLDLLAKPVYCIIHVLAIQGCDYSRLGFNSGKYSEGATSEEQAYNHRIAIAEEHHDLEKKAVQAHAARTDEPEHAVAPVVVTEA